MNNQDFGRQIRDYKCNFSRKFAPIVVSLMLFGGFGLSLRIRDLADYDAIISLGIFSFIVFIILTILHKVYVAKQRIIVYQNGLHLETHKLNVNFLITDITDMDIRKVSGYKYSSYFVLYIKLKNGHNFEMNLSYFEGILPLFSSKIPDMPELMAFYDRWQKARTVTINIKQ